eukprot:TRINITY_DN1017_c0_g3_i3.p1 TRINITY_DN1017_c0_g3~~TRINITY_DN1017_c0_g3_i3.p1  ORF type:complete len:664 (+),score=116.38 TRINITY_DN1017_c0_g3_i3:177-2168(+)
MPDQQPGACSLVHEYNITEEGRVTHATHNEQALYIALNDKRLIMLKVSEDQLKEQKILVYPHEIACLAANSNFLAFGLWNSNIVFILNPETLAEINLFYLKTTGVRSIVLTKENQFRDQFIICGMNDGQLFTLQYSCHVEGDFVNVMIEDQKLFVCGTSPIKLAEIEHSNGLSCLLACSDAPSIIHGQSNTRIGYSDVNSEPIYQACCVELPNKVKYVMCLHKERLALCTFDLKQNSIVVNNIPLKTKINVEELIYLEPQRALLLIFKETSANVVMFYDEISGELFSQYDFGNEEVVSHVVWRNQKDGAIVLFGTQAFSPEAGSSQPPTGRIVALRVRNGGFEPLLSLPCKLSVYRLGLLGDHRKIVAVVGPVIKLYEVIYHETSERNNGGEGSSEMQNEDIRTLMTNFRLKEVYSRDTHSITCDLDVHDNSILVADILKHIQLYTFDAVSNRLILIAKEDNTGMTTCARLLNSERVIEADAHENVILLRRPPTVESEDERSKLEEIAGLNIGGTASVLRTEKKQLMNVFNFDSLAEKGSGIFEKNEIEYVLMTTTNGALACAVFLSERVYRLLKDLQDALLKDFESEYGFRHNEYRRIKLRHERKDAKNVVDGDVLKRVSKLSKAQMERVLNNMSHVQKPSMDQIYILIDSLNRLLQQILFT